MKIWTQCRFGHHGVLKMLPSTVLYNMTSRTIIWASLSKGRHSNADRTFNSTLHSLSLRSLLAKKIKTMKCDYCLFFKLIIIHHHFVLRNDSYYWLCSLCNTFCFFSEAGWVANLLPSVSPGGRCQVTEQNTNEDDESNVRHIASEVRALEQRSLSVTMTYIFVAFEPYIIYRPKLGYSVSLLQHTVSCSPTKLCMVQFSQVKKKKNARTLFVCMLSLCDPMRRCCWWPLSFRTKQYIVYEPWTADARTVYFQCRSPRSVIIPNHMILFPSVKQGLILWFKIKAGIITYLCIYSITWTLESN